VSLIPVAVAEVENAEDAAPVLPRRKVPVDNNLDMTPMIDVTFLLLIFFLVASNPDVKAALKLPPAEYGIVVSQEQALVISVAAVPGSDEPAVYLADGKQGDPLPTDHAAQETAIREAVDRAVSGGRTNVVVKAERELHHRHVVRVVRAASRPGTSVDLAVADQE
jgi:biopolymer transport protein ExbD